MQTGRSYVKKNKGQRRTVNASNVGLSKIDEKKKKERKKKAG